MISPASRVGFARSGRTAEIGLMVEGQEGLTWARWATLLDSAEELGFASLHRSDHLTGIEGDADRPTLSL